MANKSRQNVRLKKMETKYIAKEDKNLCLKKGDKMPCKRVMGTSIAICMANCTVLTSLHR